MAVINSTNHSFFRLAAVSAAFSVLLTANACSPASAVSSTALVTGLIGGGAGAAGGVYLGQEDSSITEKEGAAALGAAGALVGVAAGAMARQNEIDEQKKTYYNRVPYEKDTRQEEIDKTRAYADENSAWGRNEVQSYEDRYPLEDINRPYQGSK